MDGSDQLNQGVGEMNWWILANRWMTEMQHSMACYMLSINRHSPYWSERKEQLDSELIRMELDFN